MGGEPGHVDLDLRDICKDKLKRANFERLRKEKVLSLTNLVEGNHLKKWRGRCPAWWLEVKRVVCKEGGMTLKPEYEKATRAERERINKEKAPKRPRVEKGEHEETTTAAGQESEVAMTLEEHCTASRERAKARAMKKMTQPKFMVGKGGTVSVGAKRKQEAPSSAELPRRVDKTGERVGEGDKAEGGTPKEKERAQLHRPAKRVAPKDATETGEQPKRGRAGDGVNEWSKAAVNKMTPDCTPEEEGVGAGGVEEGPGPIAMAVEEDRKRIRELGLDRAAKRGEKRTREKSVKKGEDGKSGDEDDNDERGELPSVKNKEEWRILYTDGSATTGMRGRRGQTAPSERRAAWAVVELFVDGTTVEVRSGRCSGLGQTNNEAELEALAEALLASVGTPVELRSDSRVALRWAENLRNNRYTAADIMEHKCERILRKVKRAFAQHGAPVLLTWVKGHQANASNDARANGMADRLAKQALALPRPDPTAKADGDTGDEDDGWGIALRCQGKQVLRDYKHTIRGWWRDRAIADAAKKPKNALVVLNALGENGDVNRKVMEVVASDRLSTSLRCFSATSHPHDCNTSARKVTAPAPVGRTTTSHTW